jgi:hypothetical protein
MQCLIRASSMPAGSRSISGSMNLFGIHRGISRGIVNDENIRASRFISEAGVFPEITLKASSVARCMAKPTIHKTVECLLIIGCPAGGSNSADAHSALKRPRLHRDPRSTLRWGNGGTTSGTWARPVGCRSSTALRSCRRDSCTRISSPGRHTNAQHLSEFFSGVSVTLIQVTANLV